MKFLAVFSLFVAFTAALPAPQLSDPNSKNNPNLSEVGSQRSKRFIFFSKYIVPYPITYRKVFAAPVVATPVVTPIVTKTKIVAAAPEPAPVPVTYQLKPVTYQYTYTVPSYSYSVVKAFPAAVQVVAQVPAVTETTSEATAENGEE